MLKPKFTSILIIVLVSFLLFPACTPEIREAVGEGAAQKATPVPDTATATIDVQATEDARSTAEALEATNGQATFQAKGTEYRAGTRTQDASNRLATATQAFVLKQTATYEAILEETAQAEPMIERVQMLYNEGVVATTEGEYFRVEDFEEEWAQINYFDWWPTYHSPENFAIRTDLKYASASDKANWFNSGCGFVFGLSENNDFMKINLTLDSKVNLKYWQNNEANWLAQRSTEKLTLPSGHAVIMLVVFSKRVAFYVDGVQVLEEYASLYKPGELAFTLTSGTNKGFGTRCTMTDIDLFIFK
jgi:hypothetical protein